MTNRSPVWTCTGVAAFEELRRSALDIAPYQE